MYSLCHKYILRENEKGQVATSSTFLYLKSFRNKILILHFTVYLNALNLSISMSLKLAQNQLEPAVTIKSTMCQLI